MRSRYASLLCILLVFTAGCSALQAAPLAASPQPAAAEPTARPLQPGLDPVSTGKVLLETNADFHWLEPPIPYTIEQMTFAEAHKWIPMLSEEGDQVWGTQTRVYLVAFRGRWLVTPIDSGQANPEPVPYKGCLFVLFTAADGKLIAVGDTTCPGQ